MICKGCKSDYSWHDWKQKPYCSPYCKSVAEGSYREYNQGEWTRNAAMQAKDNPDVVQPFNKDGTFSNKFVKTHGTKRLAKEMGISPREIREEAERYS